MIECTRKIEFDAGHRVIGHEHKCKYLHGHRYVLEVTAATQKLDDLGRVVDFGHLKTVVKNWIDDNFDHNVILHKNDKELGNYIENHTGQSVYYLNENPTAENIALHLRDDVIPILFKNTTFQIVKIRLYETPNCYVEVV
jgi:6-pyruvoyltetrahydropterin/6-carboxytetrahydropterin synthase